MSARALRVLIVEDEDGIASVLSRALRDDGYACAVARDGPAGLARARAEHPDFVILDLMLPGMDGVAVCRELRRESDVPILMLTARHSEGDKVLGLEAGADDYVTKPFSVAELKARIRSILRRTGGGDDEDAGEDVLVRGPLVIDVGSRRIQVEGREVPLTTTELELLRCLARRPGRVFPRDELLDLVWGYSFDGSDRTIDSHLARIRKKLRTAGAPPMIETVRGVGYRLRTPVNGGEAG